ncbi:hypothetical protein JRO89_XS07G0095900 [Xanthoceras sorbifolium]|uniref:Retrovirus-related Pol polyprotein from transposon TNT 1-94-like beta-barrel domain-containing protein n=1 Tax=Xanthoceras sorbifolium TaxID=99658 RepID=A0ABQ8HTC5_9ROSI|nr:hypothetical protein JRO89_XS07G0095900 [Xanthoceras sorbifolium]
MSSSSSKSSSQVEDVLYTKYQGKKNFTSKNSSGDNKLSINKGHGQSKGPCYRIIDSGCSHHATRNASLLSEVHPHQGKRVIVTTDNSLHPVTKEGHLNIKVDNSIGDGLTLRGVYHVPELKKNLASVSQITDSGRKESLYVLSASDAYVEKTGKNTSFSLWHA